MFGQISASSDSLLTSEWVNEALCLIFLSLGERLSSLEDVEELFHVLLQVQGKVAEDVRDILNELIQNNLLVADLTEDTAKRSIDSTMINEEHISTVNNISVTDQNDPLKMTLQTFKKRNWQTLESYRRH